MQPFLGFLLSEVCLFYLAVAGDVYLTNNLVKWFGPEVEANPRVRKMYETRQFDKAHVAYVCFCLPYLFLAIIGAKIAEPYVPILVVTMGLIFAAFPIYNLVAGSLIFYRFKKLRSSGRGWLVDWLGE